MRSVTFSTREEAVKYAEQSPACANAKAVTEAYTKVGPDTELIETSVRYVVTYQSDFTNAEDAQLVADWTRENDSVVVVPENCLAEDRKLGLCTGENTYGIRSNEPSVYESVATKLWDTCVSGVNVLTLLIGVPSKSNPQIY